MSERITRQIMLLSLIVVIIPMLLFPERLGTGLAKASMLHIFYELVFYGFVLYLLNRRTTLLQLVQACGLCLIYRLAVGVAFGLLIAIAYSMNLKVSVTLGVTSYLPAILLHVAVAPFVLWPALKDMYAPVQRKIVPPSSGTESTVSGSGTTTFVASTSHTTQPRPTTQADRFVGVAGAGSFEGTLASSEDGFSQATKYIGGDGSVQIAAVVDDEGLLLGHFQRGNWIAEDWAPLALQLSSVNNSVLGRAGWTELDRISITGQTNRIIIAGDKSYRLLVVAEQTADDILNIRINQGIEIIRKYIAQRFGTPSPELMENAYVRSTQ